MTEIYFEDGVLDATRETLGRTITEADIVLHAGQTGDFFPHHMNAEWYKTQDFRCGPEESRIRALARRHRRLVTAHDHGETR